MLRNREKKLVIYDFDGTLADTRDIAYQVYLELAKKHDIKIVSKEKLSQIMELPVIERLKYFNVPIKKMPKYAREAIKRIGDYIDSASIYPGVKEVIKELNKQQIPMYIVSSNSKKNIKRFLTNNELNYFEGIYGKASLFGKDRIISRLVKKLKLDKERVFYVGDEVRDIEASKKAEVPIISITWGYDSESILKNADPDYLARDFYEVKDIVLETI